ncbi:hypothetical protein BU17DRAFT_88463 [Hysterangium stoloniferum]|nr:hypothetical protein BU17DRAFT_88463 [Hysterangium stoloniferum]
MEHPTVLYKHEYVWRRYQPFLQFRGYMLRPRYHPNWVASWTYNGKESGKCEDSLFNPFYDLIDARRISDDTMVFLKMVETEKEELPIAMHLSSEILRSDARNRTVPILDVIPLPDSDDRAFLVMPFLRKFDRPDFQFRIECIEAIRQMIMGLEFMHEQRVAHRDACRFNFMMQANKIIPKGFHPIMYNSHNGVDLFAPFHCHTRMAVAPVDYYWIDFDLSSRFSSLDIDNLVTGIVGQDRTVPELSLTVPYDPFKVDIYQVGGLIKYLIERYYDLDFLKPLALAMMQNNPIQRPNASEALDQFEGQVSTLSHNDLKRRVITSRTSRPPISTRVWRTLREHLPFIGS